VRGVVLSAKERDFVRQRGASARPTATCCDVTSYGNIQRASDPGGDSHPQYVLAEMTLSFLGLGVPEPAASWEIFFNLQQYSVLVSYWWMYLPALAMVPFFLGYLGLASSLQSGWSRTR